MHRRKQTGFSKFIRKVEGNEDTILEKEGTGGWLTTRFILLYELGSGIIGWYDYLARVSNLSYEKRQAIYLERKSLGIRNGFDCTVGSDQPLRIRLEQASEPQSSDQVGERQGNQSDGFQSGGSGSINTTAVGIWADGTPRYNTVWFEYPSPTSSRPR